MGSRSSPNRLTLSPQPPPPDRPGRHQNLAIAQRNHALLADSRRTYAADGRYAPEVRALIREVRMASAAAGFHAMCAPVALGGGLGHLAYYVAWEAIYRRIGGHSILTPWVIAHRAFGRSEMLMQATPEAQAHCLDDIVAGRTSMCFELSEPGVGSDATIIKPRAVRGGNGWRITGRTAGGRY